MQGDHEPAVFINSTAVDRALERLRWLYGTYNAKQRRVVSRGQLKGYAASYCAHKEWKDVTEGDIARLGLA